jgi:hypothetical protein
MAVELLAAAGRRRLRGDSAPTSRGRAMIRTLLADDQALVRSGLRALLDAR